MPLFEYRDRMSITSGPAVGESTGSSISLPLTVSKAFSFDSDMFEFSFGSGRQKQSTIRHQLNAAFEFLR